MGINIEPVGATTTLGEGPHWDNKAKVLYYVDITNSTVNKYDPATKKLNTVKIVYRRHRNVAYSLVPKMEAELDRLEEEGILSKVTHADYATPVVPVMKSDGTIRICGDFKTTINPQLIIEDYPIPNIEVVVLFLAIIIFGMSGAQQTVTVDPRAVQETVKGNIDFTFSLYKILAKAKSGNIIVSPMSLEVVLAMAYFGARGETAEQIATGISLPAEQNLALDGFRHLLSSFKSTSNLTLEIANKVFTQQNYVIKEDFQALVKKSFLSEAQALNFADNVVSAGVINQWVEEKTKNKIKDLISPDMLDSLTRLVMVNAVYFKGNWQDQFKPEMTTTEPFYVSAEVKKDVRMMHLKKHFRYSEVDELEAQVLELPYEERQVSMVILLPNDRNGLPNLEAKLTSEKLTEVLSQLHSTEVNVSIPRFKLEDTIDLNSVLQEMGMNNMFEDSADFSGITDDAAGLKVSQVVQKAFIEVNEEGSEAAAATGLMFTAYSLPPPPKQFQAEHPFMFFLQHTRSQAILFLGRFGRP